MNGDQGIMVDWETPLFFLILPPFPFFLSLFFLPHFSTLLPSPLLSLLLYVHPPSSSYPPPLSPIPQSHSRMLMTSCARSSMTLSQPYPRAQTESWQCTTSQVTLSTVIFLCLIELYWSVLRRILFVSPWLYEIRNSVHMIAWEEVVRYHCTVTSPTLKCIHCEHISLFLLDILKDGVLW